MVSSATTTQEEHGDLSETVKGTAKNEHLNPEDEMIPKARKPYTITKQRERWTEEEHNKFLEALKLYGRAWRKIEEHVGSKTAVQIRSHAQKFFSKITRETESGNESPLKPIEIPPPRPKRKPVHPYPRKTVTAPNRSLSVSDQENQSSSSPTSVLSAIGSSSKEGSCKSSVDAEDSSEEVLDLLPQNGSNGQFLKLFGKTLLVPDAQSDAFNPESLYTSECNNNIVSPTRVVARKFSYTNTCECVGPDLPWLTLYGPTPVKACNKLGKEDDDEEANESSSDPSDEEISTVLDGSLEVKVQVKKNLMSMYKVSKRISVDSLKGFVPYKRCVMDRDSDFLICRKFGRKG